MTAAAGDSGTPLPQKLDSGARQLMLFVGLMVMIFWTLALSLLAGSAVAGAEVRPASEEEIATALVGCWDREEPAGSVTKLTMCFGPGDQVTTTWTTGANAAETTGSVRKTFIVVDGKLRMVGGPDPRWNVVSSEWACDVLMRLGVAMRLANCVERNDFGGEVISEPLYDSSYSKVPG